MNDEISEVLNQSEDTGTASSLQKIALLCEDTGAILDYNAVDLFDWYEAKGVWGDAANRVFSISISYTSAKELTEDDKSYQTKIINEYSDSLY